MTGWIELRARSKKLTILVLACFEKKSGILMNKNKKKEHQLELLGVYRKAMDYAVHFIEKLDVKPLEYWVRHSAELKENNEFASEQVQDQWTFIVRMLYDLHTDDFMVSDGKINDMMTAFLEKDPDIDIYQWYTWIFPRKYHAYGIKKVASYLQNVKSQGGVYPPSL